MLELSKLKFDVDTSALADAKKAIDDLVAAQERLNRTGGAGNGPKPRQRPETDNKPERDRVGLLKKLQDLYGDLASGATRWEASQLRAAREMGLPLKEVENQLKNIRKLTKDPFDSAIGSVRSVTQHFEELQNRIKATSDGIAFTTKQLKEFSRIPFEVEGKLKGQGKDIDSGFGRLRLTEEIIKEQKAYVETASKVNVLAEAEKERMDVVKQSKSAQKFLIAEMQRTETILAELNREHSEGSMLSEKHAASIGKFSNQLKAAGISGVQATAQLEAYRNKMQQISAIENKRAQNRLANALAPQISDVAVSLAGGMPLHLVMMQQGLQIRDLMGQSGVAAQDMQKVMRDAMKNMAISIAGTAAAMGQLAYGALADAGAAVVGFAGKVTGVSGPLTGLHNNLTVSAMMGNKFAESTLYAARGVQILTTAIAATGIGALVVGLGAATVAFVQLIGANNNLVRELAVTGNVFGVTNANSLQYVDGLTKVGATTREAISIIGEMSKAGNLSREQITMVGQSAIEMERATGTAISETVKRFSEFAKDPVKSLSELQIKTGAVQPEIIKLADELTKQGNAAGASALAIQELARINGEQSKKMLEDLHPITQFFDNLLIKISKVWTEIGNLINRATGTLPESQKIAERIAERKKTIDFNSTFSGGTDRYTKSLIEEQKADNRALLNLQRRSEQEKEIADQRVQDEKDRVKAEDIRSRSLTKEQQQLAARNKLLADYDFLMKRGTPMSGQAYAERWQKEVVDPFKEKKDPAATKQESYYNRVMRQLTNNTIAADNASKDLTKTQILLLEIEKEREFIAASPAVKKSIRDTAEKSIASEKEAKAIKDVTEAEDFRLQVLGKSEGIGAQYYEQMKQLERFGKIAGWSREQIEEMTRAIFNQTPAMQAHNKAIEEAENALESFAQDSKNTQAAIAMQNLDSEFRLSLLGKTTEEQRRLTIEHQRSIKILEVESKLRKKLLDIEKERKEAEDKNIKGTDVYLRLYNAETQAREDANAEIEAINKSTAITFREDLQKEIDSMKGGIADAISTALFEGGKQGSQKLRDMLVAKLKEPINVMINAFVNSLFGDSKGGGGLMSVVGNLFGGGSSGGGVMSGMSSMSSMFSAMASGIGSIGSTSIANAVGSAGGDSLGTLINLKGAGSSNMASIGSFADSLGGAIVGSMARKIISGGYSAGKGMDAFQNIGIALGSKVNPVLGAIIGAGAGVFNRMFGRKLKDSGIEGTFGGEAGFTGNTYQFHKGGLFRSNKTTRGELDAGVQQGLADQFKALKSASMGLAESVGVSSDVVKDFSATMKVSFNGLKEEEIQQKIQAEFDKIADSMSSAILGTTNYAKANETSTQTLTRLANSLNTVNGVFKNLGDNLYTISLASADMSSQLIDLFGGMDQFNSAINTYYQNFYTEQERLVNTTVRLTESFAALGTPVPASIQAYRDLVNSQDMTTDSGRRMYAALIQLSPAFNEISSTAQQVAQQRYQLESQLLELQGNTTALRERELAAIDPSNRALQQQIWAAQQAQQQSQAMAQAYQNQASAAADAQKAFQDLGNGIRAEIKRLRGELLNDSPDQLSFLSARFASTTAAARAGDNKALEALPEISQALEKASIATATSAVDIARMRGYLSGSLEETLLSRGLSLSSLPSFDVGSNYVPGDMIAKIHEGEAIIPARHNPYNPSNENIVSSRIDALINEVTMLRAETRAVVNNTAKTSRILDDVTQDGNTLTVSTETGKPLQVQTV